MAISLRRITKEDVYFLDFCVKQKIIPAPPFLTYQFTAEDLLQDYMNYDFYNCFVYVIEDENHAPVGVIDSYLMDDTLLVSYCILRSAQGNGYCSKGMRQFIDLMQEFKHIRRLQLLISNNNVASIRVAKNTGFKRKNINEETQTWEFSLKKTKRR